MPSLMLQPLWKYADFNGRARRSEYWLFYLFTLIVLIGIFAVGFTLKAAGLGPIAAIFFLIAGLAELGLIIPSLAVSFRRLHDTDRSAWWILISLIPFGGLVLLIFLVLEGTMGPNRYGPDPKSDVGRVFT